MKGLCLVTGANGHLGNTLVRTLLDQGYRVRAGVRDIHNHTPFAGLDCELVYAELLDGAALDKALEGVEVLFQVAAVFKHWARNPEAEIVEPNILGTQRVLAAASRAGVQRVVYVSSVAAVGHDGTALDETHWNTERDNAYYKSKILSEQAAWECAQTLGLNMVSVLPSAMVGPNAGYLTDTMGFLQSVRQRHLPFDPGFRFNFVDVRDVADGMIRAAEKGRAGQRYILANLRSSPLSDLITAANTHTPGYRQPVSAPRWLLLGVAWLQERWAQWTGKPAQLLLSQVRLFHNVAQEYDITKAKNELGFNPRPPDVALGQAFAYLYKQAHQPYEHPPQGEAQTLSSSRF
ncbi:NAD-dependent epimerase/dehydratase family protein [Pseudomonas sp. MAFF 301449]|uniref:NAD-dependent epimerase/dehydratase family protein n=1 Tax=Pseudomonas cyclaminis TaxID=2781239 RepID=A0ABR9SS38_9PSED|nr:NAD-dependent epimerase/dehydratase family protein [Pseudomonas cyclaminis]MBE8599986.1 NAD-dependent epimerase/dehydratase family protein [Pseudomonas cyclaminis]